MLISYNTYPWINEATGKEPITGDEFLYLFFSHKDEPEKKMLCMKPAVHPIKKHPLGFLGLISVLAFLLFGDEMERIEELRYLFLVLFAIGLITGAVFSFCTYINYYLKERKWKQKVIHDWKSDKLRYEHSKSILCSWKFDRVAPIDEKVFF
jgi:hypothetical protein